VIAVDGQVPVAEEALYATALPDRPSTSGHAVHLIDLAATATSPAVTVRNYLCQDSSAGCRVVVDATQVDVLLPATLAALVRLRRRLLVRNGGCLVVAGEGAVRSIRRSGLQFSLPSATSLSEAHGLLDRLAAPEAAALHLR
jgi:hypothetical protein